jgi:hypothetical protein
MSMSAQSSHRRRIAVGAAGLAVLFAMALGAPSPATAEKCDPKHPDVCVGGPTGKACGHQNESCCNINGYDYDCIGEDLSCDTDNACVLTYLPYHVTCTSGRAYNISSLRSQIDVQAQAVCGGWGTVADIRLGWS